MKDDIKLPPLPERWEPKLREFVQHWGSAAIKADRQQRGEPVAFSYELATTFSADGMYAHWLPRISRSMPNVPDDSIRNLQPLYVAPQPAEPVCKTCGGTKVDPGGLPICRTCGRQHTTPAQGMNKEISQFLADVMTAAGLVSHGKQCKALGERLSKGCMNLRNNLAAPKFGEEE